MSPHKKVLIDRYLFMQAVPMALVRKYLRMGLVDLSHGKAIIGEAAYRRWKNLPPKPNQRFPSKDLDIIIKASTGKIHTNKQKEISAAARRKRALERKKRRAKKRQPVTRRKGKVRGRSG